MEGEYFTYTFPLTGDLILFCKTPDGSIYSKVDDSFAHANGFRDRADLSAEVAKEGMILPEWMLWHSELMQGMCAN